MKPRLIKTSKILAIALTAAAGHADPAVAAPEQDRPVVDKKELWPLREELFSGDRESALKNVAHFRPLCDKDGYPLVGNVIRKSMGYQPSAFCAEIRKTRSSS
jgi:hypothetical protein